jgi:hypothetical protein
MNREERRWDREDRLAAIVKLRDAHMAAHAAYLREPGPQQWHAMTVARRKLIDQEHVEEEMESREQPPTHDQEAREG